MKTKYTKVKIEPFTVFGTGDSLWGKSGGLYRITRAEIRNCCNSDRPYELCLFGPKTRRVQYTDTGIDAQVGGLMEPIIQALYPKYKIVRIKWSEHGMQPAGGWSFDVILDGD